MTQTTLSNSDIVQTAINRIREHEPEEGYYWVHDSPIESAKGPCLSAYLGGDLE